MFMLIETKRRQLKL